MPAPGFIRQQAEPSNLCGSQCVCVFLCVSACVLESGNRKREWGWDWKIANACIYINTRAPSLAYVFVRVCLCACVFACAFLRGLWVDQSFWHPRQCPPEGASCQIWDQRSAASVLPPLHSLWGLSQQVSTSPEALINNQIKLSWNDSWDGWQPGRTCPKKKVAKGVPLILLLTFLVSGHLRCTANHL